MSRRHQGFWSVLGLIALLLSGCHPIQPSFFHEDGDLLHYLDVATDIEYPDVCEPTSEELAYALAPLTLKDADELDDIEKWDLTLEEAVRIALEKGKVMRQLGGLVTSSRPETLARQLINTSNAATVYDTAIVESGYGGATGSPLSGIGVEAALAEFDARLDSSITWNKNDRPQNAVGTIRPLFLSQDLGNFTLGITKRTATGGTFSVRNNTFYDASNNLFRPLPSDWTTNFEMGFQHPLLQGRGAQYNRIAGTHNFNAYSVGNPNSIDGVMIARIRTDMALADFEAGVRDFLEDIEEQYWDLHCAYYRVKTARTGRDSSLHSWQAANAKKDVGSGGAADEAQARSQFFTFKSQLQTAVTELLRAESRLRYSMGLPPADGRLIRPSNEPTIAPVTFPWDQIRAEALCRRVELRKKKWEIKKAELQLIASRNHLLPRLDATGTYRWLGLGDRLIDDSRSGLAEQLPGSNAFESLTRGNYQEWELGLVLNVPIGYRRESAQVRHHQLLLARERALLENIELEVLHQLGDAIREAHVAHMTSQTDFNGLVAAEREVESVSELVKAGTRQGQIDLLLDAQRRRAIAADTYYRSLCDYNKAIMRIHREKGTLLEYNGVYLAEGPWPGKAYFDALRRARKRSASTYIDYGYTRPDVVSCGPVQPPSDVVAHAAAVRDSDDYYVPTEAEEIQAPELNSPLGNPNTLPDPSITLIKRSSTKSALFSPRLSKATSGVRRVGAQTTARTSTQTPLKSHTDEPNTHHTTADAAASSSVRKWPQRSFPGAGVRR